MLKVEKKAAIDRIAATPYRELLAPYLTQLSKLVKQQISKSLNLFSQNRSLDLQSLPSVSLSKYILSKDSQ